MPRRNYHFRWDVDPSSLFGRELQRRAATLKPLIAMLAQTHAARAEGNMKQNAGWNDRTAFARSSLFGRAEGMTIYLGTTNDEYGHFLEFGTSRMPAFPTIGPQLQQTSVEYFEDAARLAGATLLGGAR